MFIGIDIGTGSVKGTFLLADSSLVEAAEKYEGVPEIGVQNTRALENACATLLRKAAKLSKEKREPIEGISASGHGPSLVTVDANGKASALVTTWQDNSHSAEARELAAFFPGFSKTGECWEAKVLAAWREGKGSAGKEGWNGSTALYPKDYLLFLLCGRRVVDRSTASTTAYFDREKGVWNCGSTGIDPRFLPDLVGSWEEAGKMGTTFSRNCGLADGIPVFGGGIDAWCEAVGAGAVEPGMLVDGSGTSTCISACRPFASTLLEHVIPQRALRIETISFTGGSAQWAENVFKLPVRQWKAGSYDGKPVPILFLPYLIGERSPVWDEQASALFLGLRSDDTAETLMAAVFQGAAFAVAQCVALVDAPGGACTVRAVGGGAENLHWVRMKASITGRTYQVMERKDAAPLGSALIAAFGSGQASLGELIRKYVHVEREIEPEWKYREQYGRLSESYGRIYGKVRDEMRMLAEERRMV